MKTDEGCRSGWGHVQTGVVSGEGKRRQTFKYAFSIGGPPFTIRFSYTSHTSHSGQFDYRFHRDHIVFEIRIYANSLGIIDSFYKFRGFFVLISQVHMDFIEQP